MPVKTTPRKNCYLICFSDNLRTNHRPPPLEGWGLFFVRPVSLICGTAWTRGMMALDTPVHFGKLEIILAVLVQLRRAR